MEKKDDKTCFIIMPISEVDGYSSDHFKHVYEDIIKPAVEMTEFFPLRADQVQQTNLIHMDILKRLIEAPMAVCDLSTRNPNVLFELGIRQAFDKPVVLIQEKGTPRIFDISPLRILDYSKEMKYHEVLQSQKDLKAAIEATRAKEGDHGNINSIVRLMALSSSASVPKIDGSDKGALTLDIIRSQLFEMRKIMEMSMQELRMNQERSRAELLYTINAQANLYDDIESDKMIHLANELEFLNKKMVNCKDPKERGDLKVAMDLVRNHMDRINHASRKSK